MEVFYYIQDVVGNVDICFFIVMVEDVILFIVFCQFINFFINFLGLQVEVVNVIDVDVGSFDNCGIIDSLWFLLNVFICDQVGEIINVIFSVCDIFGNVGICEIIVGIVLDGL